MLRRDLLTAVAGAAVAFHPARIAGANNRIGIASYRVGRKLNWDAARGTWVGDAEANQMMKHEYRAPFVVPERL